MLGSKPRLSRRRLIALIVMALVLILLIAEIINDAAKQAPSVGHRLSLSWVAGVEPILASSSGIATVVAAIERNPSAQTISGTQASVTAAEQVLFASQSSLQSLALPAPSPHAFHLVETVLASRVASIASLRHVLVAAGVNQPATATSACLSLQQSVSAGDVALAALRAELRGAHLGDIGSFKPWALVLPRLTATGCTSLVDHLIANPALVARFGLRLAAVSVEPNAVQINGVPNPTSTTTTTVKLGLTTTTSATTTSTTTAVTRPGTTTTLTTTTTTTLPPVTTTTLQIPPGASRSVLPPTTTITVQVVLVNSGNQPLHAVRTSVQLLSSAATQGPPAQVLGILLPGSARDLTFGPIHLGKISGSFQLQVSASASNQAHASSVITLVRSPR